MSENDKNLLADASLQKDKSPDDASNLPLDISQKQLSENAAGSVDRANTEFESNLEKIISRLIRNQFSAVLHTQQNNDQFAAGLSNNRNPRLGAIPKILTSQIPDTKPQIANTVWGSSPLGFSVQGTFLQGNSPVAFNMPHNTTPENPATHNHSQSTITQTTSNVGYRQIKIAPFRRDNPRAWFIQAEITLKNAGITCSAQKANIIAENLDLDGVQAIQDIITADPPLSNAFEQVKIRLLDIFGNSAEQRLRQLIKGEVATGGKPSILLTRLRALDTGCAEDIVRTVFLDQLPAPCRSVLSVSGVTDLRKLAEMADKYTEASGSASLSVLAVTEEPSRIVAEVRQLAA